ncbi:hypothetical protein O181_059217 [Austropuccinia psidii MF-1]|uniref:Tc1-like transposase DDE domain-containing protein n=1 Tax=Austropuccinia psidii MF-1 TaxID=1389203 RepID=A0A9Q3EG83_9BASI|nr:hypothetical protein [Austropuccinia psidii MF-1]
MNFSFVPQRRICALQQQRIDRLELPGCPVAPRQLSSFDDARCSRSGHRRENMTPPTLKKKPLSLELKGRIVGMHEGGLPSSEIARRLELSRYTVYHIISRFQRRGTVATAARSGRPQKLNSADKEELSRLLTSDTKKSFEEITNTLSTRVCSRTVRRRAQEMGYYPKVMAPQHKRTNRREASRLQFSLKHRFWTIEDWKQVIWTDVLSFEARVPNPQICICHEQTQNYPAECIAPELQTQTISITVWAAFCGDRKADLVIVHQGKKTGKNYVDMVYEMGLGPLLDQDGFPQGAILMEDGEHIHQSIACKQWRMKRQLATLDWPAQSPDLNPIKTLSKLLQDMVQNIYKPQNLDQMKAAVFQAWSNVGVECLQSLLGSMFKRLEDVIQAEGGPTGWEPTAQTFGDQQ